MYHCHVEATEHMQMGMLGNLYVQPGAGRHAAGPTAARPTPRFAYNDGDGSTGYDTESALQLGSFDHVFHELHLGIQPLPFANMQDTYPMLNGRGYPDTVNPAAPRRRRRRTAASRSQPVSSLITADARPAASCCGSPT